MINLSDLSEFPKLIQDFASYKSSVQSCSEKTVTEYLFDLRTFCRFMVSKINKMPLDSESLKLVRICDLDESFFGSIAEGDIYDFIFYMQRERGNGTASRSRKLTAIRVFYKSQRQRQLDFITLQRPVQYIPE